MCWFNLKYRWGQSFITCRKVRWQKLPACLWEWKDMTQTEFGYEFELLKNYCSAKFNNQKTSSNQNWPSFALMAHGLTLDHPWWSLIFDYVTVRVAAGEKTTTRCLREKLWPQHLTHHHLCSWWHEQSWINMASLLGQNVYLHAPEWVLTLYFSGAPTFQ